jgi:hypothetical protein
MIIIHNTSVVSNSVLLMCIGNTGETREWAQLQVQWRNDMQVEWWEGRVVAYSKVLCIGEQQKLKNGGELLLTEVGAQFTDD